MIATARAIICIDGRSTALSRLATPAFTDSSQPCELSTVALHFRRIVSAVARPLAPCVIRVRSWSTTFLGSPRHGT